MSKFPTNEAEIVEFAKSIATGLDANALTYVAPPFTFDVINDAVTKYEASKEAIVAVKAAAKTATVTKNVDLDDLVDKMKSVIRYAENVTDYNDEQLSLLGWSGRRENTALEVPGSSPRLSVTSEGPGDISLSWERPVTGGSPTSYLVERREFGTETWSLATAATDREATLTEQPRGQSLEYRVVSMNRAGTSEGSNAVSVVL